MGARRRLNVLVVGLALALAGCKSKDDVNTAPAPPASAAPADRLAPGEIPEGRERAFTLALPLHSTVKGKFGSSIHVASTHSYEELKKFVEARVTNGSTTPGTIQTRFDKVVAKRDPSKTLTIEVRAAAITAEFQSQMVIQDITAAPEPPGMTDTDRWKKAGLTPEGKPLDPKNMQ